MPAAAAAAPVYFSASELRACTDGYSCDRRLGEGGFGTVFAGYNLREFEQVAVKRVERRGCTVDEWEYRKRSCRREVMVSMRCDHPRLVKVIGMVEAAQLDDCAIVYTPVARCSLQEAISSERVWSVSERVRAVQDVAEALLALHRKHIVHADVKSQNVLLGNGEPRRCMVADFGSAQIMRRRNSMVLDHDATGYPYWSPEYREQGVLSFALDVYSLGVLMMEMYTWSLAYAKPSVTAARVKALAEGDSLAVSAMAAGSWGSEATRARFVALAGRCLSRDRGCRPTVEDCMLQLTCIEVDDACATPEPTSKRLKS